MVDDVLAAIPGTRHDVRPRRGLWPRAWLQLTALTVPLFGALYWMTAPEGPWQVVLAVHLALTVLVVVALQWLRRAGVSLAPDGVRERAYFRRATFTPVERIASVLVLDVGEPGVSSHQLFLLDEAGRTLLRMRGQLWSLVDLTQVAEYYHVPTRWIEQPLSWAELRLKHGSRLYRWERHPRWTAILLCAGVVAVAAPTLWAITVALD